MFKLFCEWEFHSLFVQLNTELSISILENINNFSVEAQQSIQRDFVTVFSLLQSLENSFV